MQEAKFTHIKNLDLNIFVYILVRMKNYFWLRQLIQWQRFILILRKLPRKFPIQPISSG